MKGDTSARAAPMKYLDKAMAALRAIGLPMPQESNVPAVAHVGQLAEVNEGHALAIARVLQHASHFNSIVREQLSAMRLSTRYQDIAEAFDSVRDDARRMVDQAADGKVDFRERLQNFWMSMSRGSIPSRFSKIKEIYLDVASDSKEQIERENAILNAYMDYRSAAKEAEVLAEELLSQCESRLNASKTRLSSAQAAVTGAAGGDRAALGRLELARDESIRAVQDEDERYQLAKDLADGLSASYHTAEVVVARIKQASDVKKRVYSRAVTFFSTNETVFTALNVAFTQSAGLNESTRTLEAMKAGINKGIESIADLGGKVLDDAVKAAYGPDIQAQSVKKLVDEVVAFQERSRKDVEEMRELATSNAREIASYVEEGKRRFQWLMTPKGI